MHITVVSSGDVSNDPAAPPLVHSLTVAGHDVSVVASQPGVVGGITVATPMRPAARRFRRHHDEEPMVALGKAVSRTKPEIIHPIRRRDVPAALASRHGLVARGVSWEVPPDRDLIVQAPHHPGVAQPAVAGNLDLYESPATDAGSKPRRERHRSRKVALVHRHTATSPGRYLAAALERAGVELRQFDGHLDWGDVPPDTSAVVFVESPYPAMTVAGANPGVPVLFWVHHGEHHLNANLRLAERYGADAILLAHSWHLAYRFPLPVHRFPFGVPTELFSDEAAAFADRSVDVAMVGAGIDEESPRYSQRYLRIHDLRKEFGGRVLFKSGIEPQAMAALYSTARIVLNDGGARHFPITMRVFEAVGAGALLATDPIPGTDLLFAPGEHYIELSWTVPAHLREVLADPATPGRAAAAHGHAMRHHTYDHRVDDLLSIADVTEHTSRHEARFQDPLDRAIAADVEVSTIATFGDVALSLPDVNVRNGHDWLAGGGTGRFDAAVVVDSHADLARVAASVRRYVYVVGKDQHRALAEVRQLTSAATATSIDDITRIDIGAPGYIVRNGTER